MTTLTIKIPDGQAPAVSSYVNEIGGEVIASKKSSSRLSENDEDEVTHEAFFGENIKRLIRSFKK